MHARARTHAHARTRTRTRTRTHACAHTCAHAHAYACARVGRGKLAARLLSACAKPAGESGGGLVALPDARAAAFLGSRRLLTIPGLQAKRGMHILRTC